MPLYEYRCQQCRHRFEVLQRLGESGAELSCPQCSAAQPEKVYSTFASPGGDSAVMDGPAGCCRGVPT